MNVVAIDPTLTTYPLPSDYRSLDERGQRMARINAVAQWRLGGGAAMCASVKFFENYYLRADPDDDFDPLYFKKGWLPKAESHWRMIGMWAEAEQSLCVCPRGFAKSVNGEEVAMVEMLTHPGWNIRYATNTGENAKERSSNIREQLYDNRRINDDFAWAYGLPRLRPLRGASAAGTEYFKLTNRSAIRFMSAHGGLRGGRPHVYVLDDIENDEAASTSMELQRSYADRLIHKIIGPSLTERGCKVRWTATFVSKQHYAYAAMETQTLPDGSIGAMDPRFDYWRRMFVDVIFTDKDGKERSIWPAMWPLTEEDAEKIYKADPSRPRPKSLESIRSQFGESVWLSEFRGRPGEAQGSFFITGERVHGYTLKDVDEKFENDPRTSDALICYEHNGEERKESIRDLLSKSRMALAGDTSSTVSTTSDYKALLLYVLTSDNLLFILDAWAARCSEDRLIDETMKMAARWRAPVVYPEVVLKGYSYYSGLLSIVSTRSSDSMGLQHLPFVKALRPGMMSKVSKISGLRFRFDHDLIKLPFFMRGRDFAFTMLFDQISGFNPEAPNGGLQQDDLLDMAAQSNIIYGQRGRPHDLKGPVEAEPVPITDMLKAGKVTDDTGLSLIAALGLQNLPKDLVMDLIREKLRSSHGAGRDTMETVYSDDSKA